VGEIGTLRGPHPPSALIETDLKSDEMHHQVPDGHSFCDGSLQDRLLEMRRKDRNGNIEV
jgi:hypothetical protein